MNGQDFLRVVNEAFAPFLEQLGFVKGEHSISGRFYRVDFKGPHHQVSVSYEPEDNAIFVIVGESRDGKFVDIDDTTRTPRLSDLNARYMRKVTAEERAANEAAFKSVVARDEEEKALLKCAKELRLVLPKYLAEQDR